MGASYTVVGRTANIRSNPRQYMFWVHRRMKQAMGHKAAFVGGQEIEPSRRPKGRNRGYTYNTLFRAVARQYGKTAIGSTTEVMLAVPSLTWKSFWWDVYDVHNGLGGVTPDRDILCWKGEHRRSKFRMAVFNCHPVSRGHYTDAQARKKRISYINQRQAFLKEYFAELRTMVNKALDEGYCVMVLGDMNDPTPEKLHKDEVRRSSGLDHMWLIPAPGFGVRSVRGKTIARRTRQMDHPILQIQGTFYKK